jgi:hypothetical protein
LEDSALLDSDASSLAVSTTPLKSLVELGASAASRYGGAADAFKPPLPFARQRYMLCGGSTV